MKNLIKKILREGDFDWAINLPAGTLDIGGKDDRPKFRTSLGEKVKMYYGKNNPSNFIFTLEELTYDKWGGWGDDIPIKEKYCRNGDKNFHALKWLVDVDYNE